MAKNPYEVELSPFAKAIIESVLPVSARPTIQTVAPQKPSHTIRVEFADPNSTQAAIDLGKSDPDDNSPPSLTKSILNELNGGKKDSIERLAFEIDPQQVNQYQSLYRAKLRLIPDHLLKRIAIQDDLVAAIANARSKQMQSFGMPPKDRFSKGFTIEPKPGIMDELNGEEKRDIQRRIDAVTEKLITCGEVRGWSDHDRMTLGTYLNISTRNAMIVGRLATEIVYCTDAVTGKRKFHSFRPTDAGR